MKTLDPQDFERLIEGALTAPGDGSAGGVFRCADGRYVKVFRVKRGLSSSLLNPYVRRFCRAARLLAQRGFRTVEVEDRFRIRGTRRHAVAYRGLEGVSLRARLTSAECDAASRDGLLARFGGLMAELHRNGVYFRANHLDNVIDMPDGGLGLVDVSDCRFFRSALTAARRARNFKPPLRYEEDRRALEAFGLAKFVRVYLEGARVDPGTARRFIRHLAAQHPALRAAGEQLRRRDVVVAG